MSSCTSCQALTRLIDGHYQNLEDDYKQSGKFKYSHGPFEPREVVKLESLEDKKTSRGCVSCQNIINNVFRDAERLTPTPTGVASFHGSLSMGIG